MKASILRAVLISNIGCFRGAYLADLQTTYATWDFCLSARVRAGHANPVTRTCFVDPFNFLRGEIRIDVLQRHVSEMSVDGGGGGGGLGRTWRKNVSGVNLRLIT